MFLLHPPIPPWLVPDDEGCAVALLADRADITVFLRADPDNEEELIPMRRAGRAGPLTRFAARLPWDPSSETTSYAFKVLDRSAQVWLAADGLHQRMPDREVLFKVCRDHRPPDWVADQIVYQIFPDRFAQGDPTLAVATDEYVYGDGRSRVVRRPWGALPTRQNAATSFHGGDLVGIRARLDYLADELGVTMLYLNPIFTSGSNHKYDTEDYFHVDPHLGGDQALVDLADALRARGMRLVLDASVNHTGINHPWFNRLARHEVDGAFQSPGSPWRSWYTFAGPAESYAGWKGHPSLPVLDYASPAVRAAIYAEEGAVLRHWLRPPYRIDGWRLDVIHMLGEGPGARNNAHYVREFRRAIREENRDAYILGEHFAEATRWLQGDQEDGAMNYHGFASPVRAWLAGRDFAGHPAELSTDAFERWLTAARARVPHANQLGQLSLLDSHDTSRFLTAVAGDLARMHLAVTLLFTYAGVPSVYYGDEIGLEGGDDPDCRRCFDWNRTRWRTDLHDHYRRLIAWRRERPEWRRGAYQTLGVGKEALLFARYVEGSVTIVGVNRGEDAASLPLPLAELPVEVASWRDADGGAIAVGGEVAMPGRSSVLLFGQAG